MLPRLLVDFDKSAARDQKLVLQRVFQITHAISIVSQNLVRRVEKIIEVFGESDEQDHVLVRLFDLLKLSTWDHTFNDVLRVLVEVCANVKETRHDLLLFIELENDEFEVLISDIFR